jgi:hypothetical protein
VQIWDTTNELAPTLLGSATNPGNRYIHSGWPTANGSHVIFHDELEEIQLGLPTRLYTLDLANLRAPTVQVSYSGPTNTTDHNGYFRGTNYYLSHYRRGIVVFDAANPSALVEIASFDNYLSPSSNGAGTDGTWGVYPFLPSGNLLVSDIENGLFVLRDQTRNLDSSSGQLGFAALSLSATENAGGINIRVQRTVGRAGPVSLQYATSGGSAGDGVDFTGGSGTLSWAAGDLADKVIGIPIIDDTSVEGSEAFTLTLSALGGGATLDGSSTLTVTITDNDTMAPPSGGGGGGSSDVVLLALLAGVLLARCAARPRRPTPS